MSEKKVTHFKRSERYVINGKEYASLSEIPEAERKQLEEHFKMFEDKNKDGIPDIFQSGDAKSSFIKTHSQVASSADAANAGDLIRNVLRDLGMGSIGTETKGQDPKVPQSKLSLVDKHREERRKERIRNYVVILVLVAVIVFLMLR